MDTFRVQTNAAPLKLRYIGEAGSSNDNFPRSNERGSIEACRRRIQRIRPQVAFRVQTNAAPLKPTYAGGAVASVTAFRVQTNAAPLKPGASVPHCVSLDLSAFKRTRLH